MRLLTVKLRITLRAPFQDQELAVKHNRFGTFNFKEDGHEKDYKIQKPPQDGIYHPTGDEIRRDSRASSWSGGLEPVTQPKTIMTECLFCKNPADSKEHMWPQWILKRVQTREPLRRNIGKSSTWTAGSAVTIKSVCAKCNNGWMSELENKSIPLIGSLLEDVALYLDVSQQTSIAIWATKTAMILDSVAGHSRFYSKTECEQLKTNSTVPLHTSIWIGRYFGRSLSGNGTDFSIDMNKIIGIANGSAVTILVGHLILQVLTIHVQPEYSDRTVSINPNPGRWDKLLTVIWPTSPGITTWPPVLSFTNYGRYPFASLLARWKRKNGIL